jgi:hypothetical protein
MGGVLYGKGAITPLKNFGVNTVFRGHSRSSSPKQAITDYSTNFPVLTIFSTGILNNDTTSAYAEVVFDPYTGLITADGGVYLESLSSGKVYLVKYGNHISPESLQSHLQTQSAGNTSSSSLLSSSNSPVAISSSSERSIASALTTNTKLPAPQEEISSMPARKTTNTQQPVPGLLAAGSSMNTIGIAIIVLSILLAIGTFGTSSLIALVGIGVGAGIIALGSGLTAKGVTGIASKDNTSDTSILPPPLTKKSTVDRTPQASKASTSAPIASELETNKNPELH